VGAIEGSHGALARPHGDDLHRRLQAFRHVREGLVVGQAMTGADKQHIELNAAQHLGCLMKIAGDHRQIACETQ
jgi:hypothetical protein